MTEIRYAKQGDLHIAYRVTGEGPLDVVIVPNWVTDLEHMWDVRAIGAMLSSLESYARVVQFDQPGTGHSDPIFGEMPSLETFVDSIEVVMDAVPVGRAALFALDVGTPAAIMFAASRPDRVSALVTTGGSARHMADEGYEGLAPAAVEAGVEVLVGLWGKPAFARFLAPSMAQDEDACEAVARWNRSALSPGMARRIFSMVFRFDVRSLLPSVGCPTLVLYPTRALSTILSHGQYLADHIPNAHMEVFDTADVLPYQQDHNVWMTGEIQEFLTGDRPSPPADDRVLATVLFTDIVGSTNRAAALGDKAWAELLARHEEIGRSMVERYRGRFINTTGDGLLATFEGPARAIRCAREMRAAIGKLGLDIRAGAHTGEIEPSGKDVSGMAVHIGARISAMAGPGEVLVSSTVKDLVVGSGIEFEDRGTHQLKGVPDEWHVFAVRE